MGRFSRFSSLHKLSLSILFTIYQQVILAPSAAGGSKEDDKWYIHTDTILKSQQAVIIQY